MVTTAFYWFYWLSSKGVGVNTHYFKGKYVSYEFRSIKKFFKWVLFSSYLKGKKWIETQA